MNVTVCFSEIHRRGGVERVAFECVRYLAARGHAVTALAADFEPVAGVRWARIALPARPAFLRPRRFYSRSTQAVHRSDATRVLNTHGCVCPTGGVHWVQSVHAAWLDRCRELYPSHSPRRVLQTLNPLHRELIRLERLHFAERRYAKLIVTTPQVRDDLERFYGVPGGDVTVIPNGFDPGEFGVDRRVASRDRQRAVLGIDAGTTVLLMVANELDRKGYRPTLQAMRRLVAQGDLPLLVVGRFDAAAARRIAEEESVADRVQVFGPSDDVAAFHAAADFFILPTQYEALCLAIIEALGSGLPVLTSRVPGAADAIVEGVNGLLVDDPRDDRQIAEMIEASVAPGMAATLRARTPGSVDAYRWDRVLVDYEGVLAAAAGGASPQQRA